MYMISLPTKAYITSANQRNPPPTPPHYVTGPLISMLCNRYSCKRVALLGAVLACGGTWLSSMSVSLGQVYLTYGVVTG